MKATVPLLILACVAAQAMDYGSSAPVSTRDATEAEVFDPMALRGSDPKLEDLSSGNTASGLAKVLWDDGSSTPGLPASSKSEADETVQDEPKTLEEQYGDLYTKNGFDFKAKRGGRSYAIDYQFYRGPITVANCVRIPDKTAAEFAAQRSQIIKNSKGQVVEEKIGLPNAYHGSDHLPLTCSYKLPKATSAFSVLQFNILACRAALAATFQHASQYQDDVVLEDEHYQAGRALGEDNWKEAYDVKTIQCKERIELMMKEITCPGYPRYAEGEDASNPLMCSSESDNKLPDILTMEEVDNQPMWKEMVRNGPLSMYNCEFAQRVLNRKGITDPDEIDGNVICWKKSTFNKISAHVHHYNNDGYYERVASFVVLEYKETSERLVIGATHLAYDTRDPASQLNEVVQLNPILVPMTNYIKPMRPESDAAPYDHPADMGEYPVIMAGDFNSGVSSVVYKYMTSGSDDVKFNSAYKSVYGDEPSVTSAYVTSGMTVPLKKQK